MSKGLLQELNGEGIKTILIPVERLANLKEELNRFQKEEELNGFQRWIVEEMYQYEVPNLDFSVKSILLAALTHPFYAEVDMTWRGSIHKVLSPVMCEFDEFRDKTSNQLRSLGYHCSPADNLPLKRLAVQSGLATYGRNNITYIEGMGSNYLFEAFFTDIPCEQDNWRPVTIAASCKNCKRCIENCPTGAIRTDHFLIDNQRCLSAINEVPGEFPDWLQPSVHHTMYDCLRCQEVCPMNQECKDTVLRTIAFNEEETLLLLEGAPFDTFTDNMKARIKLLGLERWREAIPRNLRAILER